MKHKTKYKNILECEISDRPDIDLRYKVAKDFNDRDWAWSFGSFQLALRTKQNPDVGKFNSIELDFESCQWCDPTPLLSLLCLLAEFVQQGGNVEVKLPSLKTGKKYHLQFLQFLAYEGIINIFVNDFFKINESTDNAGRLTCLSGEEIITKKLIKDIMDVDSVYSYGRSYCIPACLFQFSHSKTKNGYHISETSNSVEKIDKFVEEFIKKHLVSSLESEVPAWARDSLLYRIHMFCRETLHNVLEHAYINKESFLYGGFACLYIRFRHGGLSPSEEIRSYVYRGIAREAGGDHGMVRKLSTSFVENRRGFYEVFVVDCGQGITESSTIFKEHDSLNGVMSGILKNGKSRKPERSTVYGGLHLIRELLELSEDYIRVYDASQWWGSSLPLADYAGADKAIERLETEKSALGLAWTSRFSWHETSDFKADSRIIQMDAERAVDISSIYKYPPKCIQSNKITVIDERYSNNLIKSVDTSNNKVLLIPSKNSMKNKIQKKINSLSVNMEDCFDLIIADIHPHEVSSFIAAIHKAKPFSYDHLKKISEIIIVTKICGVLVFTRENIKTNSNEASVFLINHDRSYRYIKESSDNDNLESLEGVIKYLRLLDTNILWGVIEGTIKDNGIINKGALIREPVQWNKDISLSHFLDFPQILTSPICISTITNSIIRYKSLIQAEKHLCKPVDSMVEMIAATLNTKEHVASYDSERSLYIGSVLVTGGTLNKIKEKHTLDNAVYILQHPESQVESNYLIGWPNIKVDNEVSVEYKRIGETPVIARNGWKSYELPHYSKEGANLYYQSPAKFYSDMQEYTRPLVKLGHWEYGNDHDFLSINLLRAFNCEIDSISLAMGSDFSSFVFTHLFRLFNITLSSLTSKGQDIFRKLEPKSKSHEEYFFTREQISINTKPLLFYPSHIVTEHIIDVFLGLISNENTVDEIREHLFPVTPIKKSRSVSSMQLPGLVSERVNRLIEKKEKIGTPCVAVIFDDAAISGRTKEELEQHIIKIGIKDVFTIYILDRQRLPWPVSENKSVFYRWDVPPLGHKSRCSLCSALKSLREHKQITLSSRHILRISNVIDRWAAKNPVFDWGGAGISPIPVFLSQPKKKFGVKVLDGSTWQIGTDINQIEIKNSAGLISWVSELHVMTMRDDLALVLFDEKHPKYSELPSHVSLQLLCSQILLFSYEYHEETIKKIAVLIISFLHKLEVEDDHSSLALLTLLSLPPEMIVDPISEHLKLVGEFNVFSQNIDYQIFLSWGAHFGLCTDISAVKASQLILNSVSLKDSLWRFHNEVTDIRGKSHVSPLHRLRNLDGDYNLIIYQDALLSIDFLSKLFEDDELRQFLRSTFFEKTNKTGDTSKDITKDSESIDYSQLRIDILSMLSNLRDSLLNNINPSFVYELTNDIMRPLYKIHHRIFASIDLNSMSSGVLKSGVAFNLVESINKAKHNEEAKTKDKYNDDNKLIFQEECKFLIDNLDMKGLTGDFIKLNTVSESRYRKEYEYYIGKSFKNLYVIWSYQCILIIKNLLTNLKHTNGLLIENPWDNTEDSDHSKALMWINQTIDYNSNMLILEFTNGFLYKSCHNVDSDLFKIKKLFNILDVIGGSGKLIRNDDDKLFTVKLELPFAHNI